MVFLQIAIGIVSLLLGVTQVVKENQPIIQKSIQSFNQPVNNPIQYHYHSRDNVYCYYTDSTGRYWARVNVQGVVEYCQVNNGNPL